MMSKIIFMLGCIDERFLTLSFVIRHWARCTSLTRQHPGPWLSNFMLNLLLINQLQQREILPWLDTMFINKSEYV